MGVGGGVVWVEVVHKESGLVFTNMGNAFGSIVAAGLMIYGEDRQLRVWILWSNGTYSRITPLRYSTSIRLNPPFEAVGPVTHAYEAAEDLGLSPRDRVSAPPIPAVDWPSIPGELDELP